LDCGSNSMVEYYLAKVDVAGSNPVFRSMPPSSRGLGRRPFTAVTRIRIPLEVLKFDIIELYLP
jgi:hypothetical protein